MRSTLSRALSLALLALLSLSSLSSILYGEGLSISSSAKVEITDASANIVVEVSDNFAFQEVSAIAHSEGAKLKFSSEETGVMSIESKNLDSRTIDRISNVQGVLSVSSEKTA